MFRCVDCGYESNIFDVKVVKLELDHGAWAYKAICPNCSSENVDVLPGPHQEDFKIVDLTGLESTPFFLRGA